MLTETRNPNTHNIDTLSTTEIVRLMNEEDQSVALTVQQAIPQISNAVDIISERLADGGRLFYVGAGTSGRLGVLDAVECVPTFGVSPELVQGLIAGGQGAFLQAVEGAEDDEQQGKLDLQARHLNEQDVVVGIAASGRTPYVLGALDYANSIGVSTIAISCNDPAPLLDKAQYPIAVAVGPEVVTGSTRLKAGTAQKMVMNMLSTATFIKLGKVYNNLMVDVQITNAKLATRARNILMKITDTDAETAQRLLDAARNSVKVAAVMHLREVDYDSAQALLVEVGGHLRLVLNERTQ